MKNILLTVILFLYTFVLSAQTIDGFDSGNPDKWNRTGETFTLLLENNILKVTYNRTASSDAWDQFNLSVSDMPLSNYELHISIKADFNFQFTAKPVYADNTNDWLQKNITAGEQFTDVSFKITAGNRVLQHIYFYFDGGSTTPKTGTAWIESVSVNTLITQALKDKIEAANNFFNHTTSGSTPGTFPADARTQLETAIQSAQTVLSGNGLTQQQIDNAVKNLDSALSQYESKENIEPELATIQISDPNAFRRAKILYNNLLFYSGKKMLFGHQDATGYGVGWSNDDDRSDVKDVCGSYPAMGAWGLAGIATGGDYTRDKYRVEKFYNLGGVNTFEWHCGDPYEGKFYQADLTSGKNIVAEIIPGGPKNEWFKSEIRNIATFFKSLKGVNGESVPVIFRPWHEHTGDWFWWGAANCTKEQFNSLWKFTRDYLIDSCQVHNVLIAYSPDRFSSKTAYLDRYPGDNMVDILGFDDYWDLRYGGIDLPSFTSSLTILSDLAAEKGKVCALTETGQEKIENADWFTQTLLKGILQSDKTKRISYACVWRNASTTHFYAPYKGHASVNDFLKFYNNDYTVFMNDVPELYEELARNSNPTGYQEMEQKQMSFYPNPTRGLLMVSGAEKNLDLEVYNVQGQLMVKKQHTSEVDLSTLKDGIYFIKSASTNGKITNSKIVLNRN